MSELLSVALICAGTPLAQHCSRTTALNVVEPAKNPMECVMHGQTVAAAGLLDGESRYLKIVGERRHNDLQMLRRAGYAGAIVLVRRDAI